MPGKSTLLNDMFNIRIKESRAAKSAALMCYLFDFSGVEFECFIFFELYARAASDGGFAPRMLILFGDGQVGKYGRGGSKPVIGGD